MNERYRMLLGGGGRLPVALFYPPQAALPSDRPAWNLQSRHVPVCDALSRFSVPLSRSGLRLQESQNRWQGRRLHVGQLMPHFFAFGFQVTLIVSVDRGNNWHLVHDTKIKSTEIECLGLFRVVGQ